MRACLRGKRTRLRKRTLIFLKNRWVQNLSANNTSLLISLFRFCWLSSRYSSQATLDDSSSTNWLVRDAWRQEPVSLLEGTLLNEERHFPSISSSCRSRKLSKKHEPTKSYPYTKVGGDRFLAARWRRELSRCGHAV